MAITFINSTGAASISGSTWSMPTHSSRVGGAAFIVGLGINSSAVTVSTITDNAGNVYRLAVRRNSTSAASAELWYATNISSASTRISVTLSALSSGSFAIGQFSGVSTANPLLVTGSSHDADLSTVHSASQITPAEGNALIVSFHRTLNSTIVPFVFASGYSTWISTNVILKTFGGYLIQGAASTATGFWRTNAAGTTGRTISANVVAAFSDTAAGGGGGENPRPYRMGLLGIG